MENCRGDPSVPSNFQIKQQTQDHPSLKMHHTPQSLTSAQKGDEMISSSERGTVSYQQGKNDMMYEHEKNAIIPDDVWSTKIFPYLDYQSILRCSEVCRQFLHHVIPNVRELVIERPRDMHIIPARKFVGVENVDCQCFVTRLHPGSYYNRENIVCRDTSERFVPFIGCFPNAKHVRICYGTPWCDIFGSRSAARLELEHCKTLGAFDIVHRLIISICAAYRTGLFPPNMKVYGLFEDLTDVQKHLHGHDISENDVTSAIFRYNTHEDVDRLVAEDPSLLALGPYNPNVPGCSFCNDICSYLPVEQACRLRSANYRGEVFVVSDDFYKHNICLLPEEKACAIVSRRGGREAYMELFKDIYSSEKFSPSPFWSSGQFVCDVNGNPNPNGEYYMRAFGKVELHLITELKFLIDRHGFPSIQHPEQLVIEAIFEFVSPEEMLTNEKDKCFMCKSTFQALSNLFGLSHNAERFFVLIDDDDFEEEDDILYQKKHYMDEDFEYTEEDRLRLRRKFQS